MLACKRAIDIILGAMLLVILSPLLAGLALAIWLEDYGPAFYKPQRIGKDGTQFTLYKFRTMVVGAHDMLAELAHLNLGREMMIKIPNDPRVTRVGRVLRKFSLDELPQLWNVVKGDMSLVGPRPQAPDEVIRYTADQRRRLAVMPGMTGLWQVSARNDPSFDVWVAYDLEYIARWSIWLDIKILLQTIPVVVNGKDASPKSENPGNQPTEASNKMGK